MPLWFLPAGEGIGLDAAVPLSLSLSLSGIGKLARQQAIGASMDRFREASMSEKTDEGTVSTPSVDTPSSSTPSTTTGTTTTAAMTTTATTATARTATTTTTGRKRDGIRKGTRTMTPEQLERKRANDREAQRTIRQRTKEHIENLENQVAELRAKSEQMNRVMQRNAVLEAEIAHLRQQLAVLNSKRAIYSSVCKAVSVCFL